MEHKTSDWMRCQLNFLLGPQEPPPATVQRRKLAWFEYVTHHDSLSSKLSCRVLWRVGDSVVSRGNAGWTEGGDHIERKDRHSKTMRESDRQTRGGRQAHSGRRDRREGEGMTETDKKTRTGVAEIERHTHTHTHARIHKDTKLRKTGKLSKNGRPFPCQNLS